MSESIILPEERRWHLLRTFFTSWRKFQRLFAEYERRVSEFSRIYDTDRQRLRLEPQELATLMDFKALEELRDGEVSVLRDVSHELFRSADETDRFDYSVSIIYHELSTLKEEHYTLREEFVREESVEYDRFYREVNRYYPKRLRHIRNLYKKAGRRLRQLLPAIGEDRVVVRSLYLFGEDLVAGLWDRGLDEVYLAMYPTGGPAEALAVVARSFEESGFLEEAVEAWERCIALSGDEDRAPKRRHTRARLGRLVDEAEERLAVLETDLEERRALNGAAGV